MPAVATSRQMSEEFPSKNSLDCNFNHTILSNTTHHLSFDRNDTVVEMFMIFNKNVIIFPVMHVYPLLNIVRRLNSSFSISPQAHKCQRNTQLLMLVCGLCVYILSFPLPKWHSHGALAFSSVSSSSNIILLMTRCVPPPQWMGNLRDGHII